MFFKRRFWISLCLLVLLSMMIPQKGQALSTPSITILTPGEGSETTAPINVTVEVHPGADNLVRITLVDQKNNLLARKLLRVTPGEGNASIQLETDLAFEIPIDTTTALLTVSTQDEDHRPQSLRSVALVLESEGKTTIQAYISSEPWLSIDEPAPLVTLGGGQVMVAGKITPINDNPVRFELIKSNGAVIGSTQLMVKESGETFDFEVKLPYAFVTTSTDVRLVIRQLSNQFYGFNAILDSVPITLIP
jgi:hypothetical protein